MGSTFWTISHKHIPKYLSCQVQNLDAFPLILMGLQPRDSFCFTTSTLCANIVILYMPKEGEDAQPSPS